VWASFHATKPDTVATTAAPRDWQVPPLPQFSFTAVLIRSAGSQAARLRVPIPFQSHMIPVNFAQMFAVCVSSVSE
jgi:hypothetical protein